MLSIFTFVGTAVSLHVHVNVVFAVIVTLVLGSYVPFHFGVLYPLAVLHVIVVNVILQLCVGAVPFHVIVV